MFSHPRFSAETLPNYGPITNLWGYRVSTKGDKTIHPEVLCHRWKPIGVGATGNMGRTVAPSPNGEAPVADFPF